MAEAHELQELAAHLTQEDILREQQARNMHEFVKGAWPTLEPGREFHDNWHIQAICEHLEAVADVTSGLKRLIINIPPRHMKSLTCAVAFPCHTWIKQPHKQFVFASYNQALSTRDNVKCRRLMTSPWYQSAWSSSFRLTTDQNQKQRFENNQNGHRIATSVNAGLTGDGGDIIVIDDPHNVKQAESEAVRNEVLDWWDTAVPSRLNDPVTGAFVIIMQRIHQSDLTGHILQSHLETLADPTQTDPEDWTHLCVPAEYETEHPHHYFSTLPTATHTEDPRTQEDELLWPSRFPAKQLAFLKSSLGSYGSAGQLQQRPAPKGGGILRSDWWEKWERASEPDFVYILQSWDTAYSVRDTASYSACTTWGVFVHNGSYNVMILNRWRDRIDYPSLRKRARKLYDEYSPDAVMIEKKASGQSLIQDLRQMGIPCIPYTPDRDKVARCHAASPLLEGGVVWYPDRKWAQEVINHCAIAPAGNGMDIVDTVTQALIRLRTMWYASHPDDEEWEPEEEERAVDSLTADIIDLTEVRGAYYG